MALVQTAPAKQKERLLLLWRCLRAQMGEARDSSLASGFFSSILFFFFSDKQNTSIVLALKDLQPFRKVDTSCCENNDQIWKSPWDQKRRECCARETSLELTPALLSTLLSESILEAYGLNFHVVGDISSLHCWQKAIWMISHPHSSIIAPVLSGLIPWDCIYHLVCQAAELLCTEQLIL